MENELNERLQVTALALVQNFKNQASFEVVVGVITRQTEQAATLRECFLAGFSTAKGWDIHEGYGTVSQDFLEVIKQVKEEDVK
jgi:hypothetical protein